jgi:threonine synthase
MWRWAAHLVPVGTPVSLGEGGTPLVDLDLPGAPGRILVKDERANPTGCFKDRLASAAVSRARHVGADTVVVASSGNAGIAVSAFAAAAGLRTVLLATADPPQPPADRSRRSGAGCSALPDLELGGSVDRCARRCRATGLVPGDQLLLATGGQ